MVFKGRFFSSKKSDTSSPDASSNSPRSLSSNSPSRSDKKKPKPASNQTLTSTAGGSGGGGGGGFAAANCRQTQVKDGTKKKDAKGKETPTVSKKLTPAAELKEKESPSPSTSSVSPILASSLGLNRIKTRSGPLPQESFFGFRGDKGGGAAAALGASNLSRPGGGGGKKKEVVNQNRVGFQEGLVVDNGSSSDGMSTGSGGAPSREQSPVVLPRSRLQNGESSSDAGITGVYLLSEFSSLVRDDDDDDDMLCDHGMRMCLPTCKRELWIFIIFYIILNKMDCIVPVGLIKILV